MQKNFLRKRTSKIEFMKIFLIGYMGSGKSTVGRMLADEFQWQFIDLDHYIEAKENCSISTIFKNKGEVYFRRKELESLKELLVKDENLIVSLGGGTPCFSNVMELISQQEDSLSVYLKTSIKELSKRLFSEKNSRPLIAHLDAMEALEDFIAKHLFERSFFYEQSEVVIKTDQKMVKDITTEIITLLQ